MSTSRPDSGVAETTPKLDDSTTNTITNTVVSNVDEPEDEEFPYPWRILWFILCFFTLGFPEKYRERLTYFEDLVPKGEPWTTKKTFSDRGEDNGGPKTMRQKQQEEWDRLNIAVSVITATSAAALAIQAGSGPSPNQIYWLVTAFYSAAFGMSLQGLIIITYITISAGSASDEAIGRLAKGEMFDGQPIWPVAFMTALPAILATYSSFALLAGLVAMIVQGPGETVATKTRPYIALAVVPVATTFLGLLFVIGLCEYGTYLERSKRKEAKARKTPTKPKGQENKRPAILNALPSLSYIFPWASPAASAPGNPSAKLEKPEERAPQHESV